MHQRASGLSGTSTFTSTVIVSLNSSFSPWLIAVLAIGQAAMVSPAPRQCNLGKPPLEHLKVQRRERVFSAVPDWVELRIRLWMNELLEAAPLFLVWLTLFLYQDKAILLRS